MKIKIRPYEGMTARYENLGGAMTVELCRATPRYVRVVYTTEASDDPGRYYVRIEGLDPSEPVGDTEPFGWNRDRWTITADGAPFLARRFQEPR